MTTTSRRKATAFQRWIQEWLEARSWLVHNEEIGGRFKAQRDIFGCIDLIAKKRSTTLWIQAKAGSRPAIKPIREKFSKVPWTENDLPMLWIKRSREKIDIYLFDGDKFIKAANLVKKDTEIMLSFAVNARRIKVLS